jgi:hypothetical protein
MEKKSQAKKARNEESASELCFVIMPFDNPFNRYYSNIYCPAINDAGLKPIRADSLFRSSPILGDIWRFTRQAKVLLAVMTDRNPNVFYELGLAHAIAQPVVLVASSMEDVPFDLRGLRVITYDKNDESWGDKLRNDIKNALEETLQDLNIAVPPTFLEAAATSHAPKEEPVMLELRKLQDTVRAIQASLGHWVPHLIDKTRGDADAIVRYTNAFKYLDHHLTEQISLGAGMRIMSAIINGRFKAASSELHKATHLTSQEAENFVQELVIISQPPKAQN